MHTRSKVKIEWQIKRYNENISMIPKKIILIYFAALPNNSLINLPPSSGYTGKRFSTAKNKLILSFKIRNKIILNSGPAEITNDSLTIVSFESYLSAIPKKDIFKHSGFPPTAIKAARCAVS